MLYAPVPLAFARLKVLLCYIALPCRSITHYGFMRPLFAALRCGRKNPSFRDSASLYAKIKLNSKLHISRVGAVFVVMRSLRPYTVLAYGCAPQSAKIATVGVYISVFSSTVTHCV
ncbi:hypothetical protein HMPREF0619_01810 [Parabacteroides sp. D13]|nr:hypothetical protein HMPREF0619_01810 [Parabacteroides sp. D13]